jgi:hypothetical protein
LTITAVVLAQQLNLKVESIAPGASRLGSNSKLERYEYGITNAIDGSREEALSFPSRRVGEGNAKPISGVSLVAVMVALAGL